MILLDLQSSSARTPKCPLLQNSVPGHHRHSASPVLFRRLNLAHLFLRPKPFLQTSWYLEHFRMSFYFKAPPSFRMNLVYGYRQGSSCNSQGKGSPRYLSPLRNNIMSPSVDFVLPLQRRNRDHLMDLRDLRPCPQSNQE